MTKIQSNSYIKALEYLKHRDEKVENIYIIGDVVVDTHGFLGEYHYTQVIEADMVQIYFGIMCKHYILSESTFHLWIAYLGTKFGSDTDKTVVCFHDTDITNRNLVLDNWVRLDLEPF
jgi:hypothetical protein